MNGDGGFMFNVQELATAVHFRIPVVSIVFNDNAYGNVRRMQQDLYGGRRSPATLRTPILSAWRKASVPWVARRVAGGVACSAAPGDEGGRAGVDRGADWRDAGAVGVHSATARAAASPLAASMRRMHMTSRPPPVACRQAAIAATFVSISTGRVPGPPSRSEPAVAACARGTAPVGPRTRAVPSGSRLAILR